MGIWDELTLQQYAVMLSAMDEHPLNQVIYEIHSQRFWRTNGGVTAQPPPPISEQEVRSLIPQFAEVVADLIARGWIEIREPWMPWDEAPIMTPSEITQTLADPDTWIWDEEAAAGWSG